MKRMVGLMLTAWLGVSGAVVQAAEVDAVVEWSRRVELTTQVSGTIREVLVRPGDSVEQGHVLLRLDPRQFDARVAQAKARATATKQASEEAQREWERAQELYDRTVLSDHELEVARIASVTARSELQVARAALTQAELDAEYSAVRAPFDGVVLEVNAELGQTVVTRLEPRTLLAMAATGRYVARAQLELDQLSRLAPGQEVSVKVGDKRHSGTIAFIGLEPAGALYPLDVLFEVEPGSVYRRGQPAIISLP